MKTNKYKQSTKFRNTIITLSVLAILTPFILISNLYPFMRFSMFAEKVDNNQGIEVFEVRLKDHPTTATTNEIAIPAQMLNSIIRNRYYKGQILSCIKHLYSLSKEPICIYRKEIMDRITKEELVICYPNG